MERDEVCHVLLCTPYDMSHDVGGIPMWAKAVVAQYEAENRDILLEIFPMDRSNKTYQKESILYRMLSGIIDYRYILKNFKSRIADDKYDVIHICSSASISLFKDLLLIRYARKKRCRSIIHFHFGRTPELAAQNNWEWKLLKRVVTLTDMAVTMDINSYNALRAAGFTNVENIPNPLSKAIIEQVGNLQGKVERVPNTVLFVGHVIPTKGVYELVQAVNAVPDLSLRIVGKCNEITRAELTQLAIRDNGKWLIFVGVIPHDEVIKEMLTCDIFVLPSYTEGFPNVILESMACGCATIATPVGAISEMLQFGGHDMCGLKIDVKDAESIKQQLLIIQSDKELKEQCRRNAVARVNEMYAVPAVWNRLVVLWSSLKY